jgi:hypothetical protein
MRGDLLGAIDQLAAYDILALEMIVPPTHIIAGIISQTLFSAISLTSPQA